MGHHLTCNSRKKCGLESKGLGRFSNGGNIQGSTYWRKQGNHLPFTLPRTWHLLFRSKIISIIPLNERCNWMFGMYCPSAKPRGLRGDLRTTGGRTAAVVYVCCIPSSYTLKIVHDSIATLGTRTIPKLRGREHQWSLWKKPTGCLSFIHHTNFYTSFPSVPRSKLSSLNPTLIFLWWESIIEINTTRSPRSRYYLLLCNLSYRS